MTTIKVEDMLYRRLAHQVVFVPNKFKYEKNQQGEWLETAKTNETGSRGYVYAIGGNSGTNTYQPKAERYDVALNKWTKIADLPWPSFSLTLVQIDHQYIFAFGGIFESKPTKDGI